MKYLVWAAIISACFMVGLMTYTPVAPLLLGDNDRGNEGSGSLVSKVTLKGPDGLVTFEVNFDQVQEDDLPASVSVLSTLEVTSEGHPSLLLEKGNEVRVRRLDGRILLVSAMEGPLQGSIPVDSTDLARRIAQLRLQKLSLATARNDSPTPTAAPAVPIPAPKGSPEPPAEKTAAINSPPPPATDPKRPVDPAPAASPGESEFDRLAEKKFPLPEFPPLMKVVDDWKAVPRNAYPKTVIINIPLDYDLLHEGEVVGRGELPAGSAVEPVELTGSELKIATVSVMPTHTSVPVDHTDFKERVTARYEESVAKKTEAVLAMRATESERLARAATHEKNLRSYNEGDDPRFDAVRDSLRQGDAGFYELEAASKWRWAGKETIDGVEYEVTYVMMASESAFGVIQRELKALLHDNKVAKWIDVASGQEL